MNYFKLLTMEEGYDIDPANLDKQYFAHLAKYHPDRAVGMEQKRKYHELSININKAYSILKDNLKRAEHILNLRSIATDETTLKNKISKEKLIEIWEEYNRLDDVNHLTELEYLLNEKQAEHEKLTTDLKEAFKNNDFNCVLDIIISFKYLITLIDNIKLKIKMQIIEISEPNTESSDEQDGGVTVGIDFGTTNSLIAVSHNKQVKFIRDIRAREIIPSVIEWNNAGEFDIASNSNEAKNSIRSLKRLLGKSSAEVSSNPKLFKLVENFIDLSYDIPRLKIHNRVLSLPEVAAEIFKYLKNQAEKELNCEVKKAVVTVPAYFDEGAKGAVMLAAKLAGLQVLRLIAEPTAAAYAYGLNKDSHGCYLVYDLGGGTFDVSVLNMQAGILQVIATGGDNMLGGDDIDHALLEYFQQTTQAPEDELLAIAKLAKEALTYNKIFTSDIYHISLEDSIFEQIISPIIERTIGIVSATLEQAGNPKLDGIILVGGSSRIPLISKSLKQNFETDIFSDVDPDRVVAAGAALQAENLTTDNLNSLLIDVIPLSIGLELYGGLTEKIILRNSAIPLSVIKEFTTYADNQTAMQFHILQGEREEVKDCRSLAKFELKDIPPMKAGTVKVEVIFSIDADGILSVSAQEKVTGKSQIIEVKPSYGLSENEIDLILQEAFKNADLDHKNRLLQETILSAKSLIYNTENAIKEMPDILPVREMNEIHQAIRSLKKTLANNKRETIFKKIHKLEKQLEKFVEARFNFAALELLKGKKIDKL